MMMLQLLQKAINEKKKAINKRTNKRVSKQVGKKQFVKKIAKQHNVHRIQMNQYQKQAMINKRAQQKRHFRFRKAEDKTNQRVGILKNQIADLLKSVTCPKKKILDSKMSSLGDMLDNVEHGPEEVDREALADSLANSNNPI